MNLRLESIYWLSDITKHEKESGKRYVTSDPALKGLVVKIPCQAIYGKARTLSVSTGTGVSPMDTTKRAIDEVKRLADGSIEVVSRIIPYATSPETACRHTNDCAVIMGHEGPCYLTEWLFDADERERLRKARGNT